jgi:signal transduction histidine kinase
VAPAIIFIAHDRECKDVTFSTMSRGFLRLGEGRSPSKSLPPDLRPLHFRITKDGRELPTDELPLPRAANGEAQRDVDLTLEFDDGSVRYIYGNAAPLFDQAGAPRGAVSVFIDVTAQRKALEAMRRAEKIAVAGRLAASIAHEINNPLEAITNLLYLAATAPDLEQARQFTASAQEQLRRVSAIVTQTLRFHRQTTRIAEFSISDVLESVLSLWQRRFDSKEIAVVRQFSPTPHVSGYEGELRQAFANLIGNAFEASGAKCQVIVRTRAATDPRDHTAGIRVTIADTGHGMDPPTMRRVFEPFFTTRPTGTGLGMWVTAEIVDKHGGSLHVRSRRAEPSGTVISVFLPLRKPAND